MVEAQRRGRGRRGRGRGGGGREKGEGERGGGGRGRGETNLPFPTTPDGFCSQTAALSTQWTDSTCTDQ